MLDKYFKPFGNKQNNVSAPASFDQFEFYKNMTNLDPDNGNSQDLTKVKFYVLSVQNLMEFKFIFTLLQNVQKADEAAFFESKFIKYFIDYAW